MRHTREIVEETSFAASRRALGKSDRHIDEALQGVTWTIAHAPERGTVVPERPSLFAMASHGNGAFPHGLVVFYTFDADTVRLLHVMLATASEATGDDE